jgi:hypothetical protein
MNHQPVGSVVVLGVGLLLAALTGCERETPARQQQRPTHMSHMTPMPQPVATYGDSPSGARTVVENEGAISAMGTARCDREQRCGNVGPGKDHENLAACQSKLMASSREELGASECPGGIVKKELDECLGEIRTEDCGNPLDTLGRLVACRSSDLCSAIP